MAERVPDIVIGVDFGMTCTGVAYSTGPEWSEPKVINSWPGTYGPVSIGKVKTAVCYDVETRCTTTWGFQCDPFDESMECNEYFKLHLDPTFHDSRPRAPKSEEAQAWYLDYLQALYGFLTKYFEDRGMVLPDLQVEFAFSIPTTWKKSAIVANIESLIHRAGFGSYENHRATVTLTEAEAAAVYATKRRLHQDEVFMVLDAGGGTTDLNVLKVVSPARGNVRLEPLSYNEGVNIGATAIDAGVRTRLEDRLRYVESQLKSDIESTVYKMMQDRYESFKCNLGADGGLPKLLLPIPDFPPGRDYPHAGIEDSKAVLLRTEFEMLFNEQLSAMTNLIDEQLTAVQASHPGESISYLILSGGFGGSPYVQNAIKSRYHNGKTGRFPNAEKTQVILAEEPHLAVVKGLVFARIQLLARGSEPLTHRLCPMSYGILVRNRWDPDTYPWQVLAKVVVDPYDKQKWVENEVFWFAKKGSLWKVNDGPRHPFRHKLAVGQEQQPWHTSVVECSLPAEQLPHFKNEDVHVVCRVKTKLHNNDMRRKNHKWYHLKPEYNLASFDVKMVVGVGLRFEIWGHDGTGQSVLRSLNSEEIAVAWESPMADDDGKSGMS